MSIYVLHRSMNLQHQFSALFGGPLRGTSVSSEARPREYMRVAAGMAIILVLYSFQKFDGVLGRRAGCMAVSMTMLLRTIYF
jgi:hypothetical protein